MNEIVKNMIIRISLHSYILISTLKQVKKEPIAEENQRRSTEIRYMKTSISKKDETSKQNTLTPIEQF